MVIPLGAVGDLGVLSTALTFPVNGMVMSKPRRFWARKPLRNAVSGVREGGYSEPIQFIEIDGRCYEVDWIKSVETLSPRPDELKEVSYVPRSTDAGILGSYAGSCPYRDSAVN